MLRVWTCGRGGERGTHSLPGLAVAAKQGGRILVAMAMVSVPGPGQPARGGWLLPAQKPARAPGCEVWVAEGVAFGVQSTRGRAGNPTHEKPGL